MKLTFDRIDAFQTLIFSWWEAHRRDLPWRKTRDPYNILVSEVMLQQTQVSRVLPKYEEFLRLFPTVKDLSLASSADVLKAWKGMGYNRRALYLKKSAEIVVRDHHGIFPKNESELRKLPGLGIYTARAILVFGYDKQLSFVDTNIRQIIIHHFFTDEPQKESVIQLVAHQLLPVGKAWEWHQALMDYGALALPSVIARSPRRSNLARKPHLPFRQTNRFFRGRIIDALREGDVSEKKLVQEMVKKYEKPASFIKEILVGLARDGLLTRHKNGIISLPK